MNLNALKTRRFLRNMKNKIKKKKKHVYKKFSSSPKVVLNIKALPNNGFFNLIFLKKKKRLTLYNTSLKSKGFKKRFRRNKTGYAQTIKSIANWLKKRKLRKLILSLDAPRYKRRSFLKTLRYNRIKILAIIMKNKIPHNGCKPEKKRRI